MVLDSVALGNHSHTVRAIGSKEMSRFVAYEDLSLGSHQGTTLVCALGHHATNKRKINVSVRMKHMTCLYLKEKNSLGKAWRTKHVPVIV